MNDINVLDKSIYNRIAAGEVVERPSSIVKELVENSIDAGATSVSVEIRGGGVDYIRIADNGKGIAPADVPTAFLAHATSKIKSVEDLDGISTLGFRGEALPSIAAVSKITMQTRRKDSATGYRYVVDNGRVLDSGEIGCPYGTTVVVEDVFGNIPARKKFLAKNQAEESSISSLVAKMILANYDVAISLTINDKLIYRSLGQGLDSAINCVYGEEYLNNLTKVEAENFGMKLIGYFGKPSYTKHNKSYQTVIINNRFVNSEDISYWIYGCYSEFLMKRQFPTFVMHIEMPYDMIDVNVHPNKLEVKFASVGLVKKLITDCVRNSVLSSVRVAKEIFFQPEDVEAEVFLPDDEVEQNKTENKTIAASFIKEIKIEDGIVIPEIIVSKETELKSKGELRENTAIHFSDMFTQNTFSSVADLSQTHGFNTENLTFIPEESNKEPKNESISLTDISTPKVEPVYQQQDMGVGYEIKYVGKVFNTYLIFESKGNMYLIDQHAAHERILYDKLESDFVNGKTAVQNFLFPYDFTVSKEEADELEQNIEYLARLGFIFTRKSVTEFALSGVPVRCGEINISSFLSSLLHDISANGGFSELTVMKDKLMQNACKHAIKGEMDLNIDEIKSLLQQMTDNDIVLYCPHGRPIVVNISKTEVEKWFKRIV